MQWCSFVVFHLYFTGSIDILALVVTDYFTGFFSLFLHKVHKYRAYLYIICTTRYLVQLFNTPFMHV